ncbi:MAG: GNAT family N-acetyltransferase [Bacteroidales bacterium]|nr:GNAT family N-acetyltransferase [Bacteroidales bacterium]
MKLNRFFEEYFLKKRYIFSVAESDVDFSDTYYLPENLKIEFYNIPSATKEKFSDLLKQIVPDALLGRYTSRYEQNDNWKLLVAYSGGKPVGCNWILHIPHDNFLFDSFLHNTDHILLGNFFVIEEFRGKGINKLLVKRALSYIYENHKNKIPVFIVERSNISSIKSSEGIGAKVYGVNYLLKFLKRNVISIYVQNKKLQKIWFLLRYKQSIF